MNNYPPANTLVKAIDDEGLEVDATFGDGLWVFPNGGTGNAIVNWKFIKDTTSNDR